MISHSFPLGKYVKVTVTFQTPLSQFQPSYGLSTESISLLWWKLSNQNIIFYSFSLDKSAKVTVTSETPLSQLQA